MDKHSSEVRRRIMQANKGKDTNPELRVRRMLHAMGLRFRLHRKDLPSCPDIVLPKLRICIFVHGCFWHQHEGCKLASKPKARAEYWESKFAANKARDQRNLSGLANAGWRPEIIWECETKNPSRLRERLENILEKSGSQ